MKLDRTTYSKEFLPNELTEFILDAWNTYAENKHIKVGYGLTEKQAQYISHAWYGIPEFFEGKCYQIMQLDPNGKHLKNEDYHALFRRIADNIIEDKKFREHIKKLGIKP